MARRLLKRLVIGEFSLRRIVLLPVYIYAGLLLTALLFSNMLIFRPHASSYRDCGDILKIRASDGVSISARYFLNSSAKFTILFSHGNAEDLGDIEPLLKMYQKHGYAIFAYDYHGYGTSDGSPSEKAAYQDIEACFAFMVDEMGIPPDKIIALGRSLGSGPATYLASRERIAGLILESPFMSAFRVITRIRLLPFDKFLNIDRIGNIGCPVLVVAGKDDEVVSIRHARKLFAKAPDPKMCLWVEGAGHNDLLHVARDSYWKILRSFVNTLSE